MLRAACGGEEKHTNNAVGHGMWAGCSGITINTTSMNTGDGCYLLSLSHVGNSPSSYFTGATKCRWTFASVPFMRNNGTFLTLFSIFVDDAGAERRIVWYYNTGDGKYYLQLRDGHTPPNVLATSTNGTAVAMRRFKLEFDGVNDEWTLWSDISGSWQEEFTYSDSTTPDYIFRMSLNSGTDVSKVNTPPIIDDCCFWDNDGDNWNTRGPIDTYANSFPRISAAHVPAAGRESHAGQGVKLDEIPPDAVDKATIDEPGYYVQVTALKNAPEDYTAETIQAVLITHVAGDFSAEDPEMNKFNVRRSGTTYLDSAEYRVMVGQSGAGGGEWWQFAGYYPWTPLAAGSEESWTELIFNACDYGISLIDGKTDQMTVQVIYFGTSHEWEPPAPPSAMRRLRGVMV